MAQLSGAAEYGGVTTRTIRCYLALRLSPASSIKGSWLIRIDRADVVTLLRPIPAVRWHGRL